MQTKSGVVDVKGDRAGTIGVTQRLASLSGSNWSVTAILNDALPEQLSLREAQCLFEPKLRSPKVDERKLRRTRGLLGNEVRDQKHLMSLEATALESRALSVHGGKPMVLDTRPDSFRQHMLSLWEDKFRLKRLELDDVLFLLAQPNIASTLESASFLREVRISYDQVMELEMTLAMLREQPKWSKASTLTLHRMQTRATLCGLMAWNVWMHGQAFRVGVTSIRNLPKVTSPKRKSPKQLQSAIATPTSRETKRGLLQKPAKIQVSAQEMERCPASIRAWIRDHCIEEISRSSTIQKQVAAEKLMIILSRHCHQTVYQRFSQWRQSISWARCHDQVGRFCRLKCALFILQRSRTRLQHLVIRVWSRWMTISKQEHEDEIFVAAVMIQSWLRGVRGRQAAAVHNLHQAAILIQANWRGFHSRRMVRRRRRFLQYSAAAHRVQRYYHSYIFRVRCAVFLKYQRAARRITRAIRQYIEKKRDFAAWLHHLARYHAAIAIQLWLKRTTKRIRRERARRAKLANAQRVLFDFFRRLKFLRCFGLRLDRVVKRKHAAAVLLQNAYRAKRARARFYELKVRLEDQRRQEILRFMWHNAYAATIQKWWRKRRQRRA